MHEIPEHVVRAIEHIIDRYMDEFESGEDVDKVIDWLNSL